MRERGEGRGAMRYHMATVHGTLHARARHCSTSRPMGNESVTWPLVQTTATHPPTHRQPRVLHDRSTFVDDTMSSDHTLSSGDDPTSLEGASPRRPLAIQDGNRLNAPVNITPVKPAPPGYEPVCPDAPDRPRHRSIKILPRTLF